MTKVQKVYSLRSAEARPPYSVHPSQEQLRDVAVDGLHGQLCLGQVVGYVASLYLLSTSHGLRILLQASVYVTFSYRNTY